MYNDIIYEMQSISQHAEIFFHMVTRGTEFQEYGVKRFEKEHKEQTMKNLKRKAKVLGFELIPATV